MKNKVNKRLLSGVTALMLTMTYFSSMDIPNAQAAGVSVESIKGSIVTDDVTLLAGTSNVKADTLAETIRNYREEYALGVASDFSVFLKDDLTVRESDAEGRVAVGGDLITATPWLNYTIGAGDYSTRVALDELLSDKIGSATVILGGTLEGQLNDTYYAKDANGTWRKYESNVDGNNRPTGNLTPTEKSTKKIVLNKDTLGENDIHEVPPKVTNIPEESSGNWQKVDQTQTYVTKLLDFEDEFDYLCYLSAQLSQSSDDYDFIWDAAEDHTVTFKYTGGEVEKDCVYFTLAAEDFDHFRRATYVRFENIPKLPSPRTEVNNRGEQEIWEYAYIIVNVEGTGNDKGEFHIADPNAKDSKNKNPAQSTNGSKMTCIKGVDNREIYISKPTLSANNPESYNNHIGTSSILYNFYEADDTSTIVLGNNFQGNIFAPRADVTDEITLNPNLSNYPSGFRGHLSGALIANSFDGVTEFGYRPFSAPGSILRDHTYNIDISKVDDEGGFVSGAVIDLYKIEKDGEVLIDSYESGIDNKIGTFIDLEAGRYVLRESKVPVGYTKADDIYFEIESGKAVNVGPIYTGDTRVTPKIYLLKDIDEQTNWDTYIDAENRTVYNWGTDLVSFAMVNTGDLIVESIIFRHRNGDIEEITPIKNLTPTNPEEGNGSNGRFKLSSTVDAGNLYKEIYKYAGADENIDKNEQPEDPDDIVSISIRGGYYDQTIKTVKDRDGTERKVLNTPSRTVKFKLQYPGDDGYWHDIIFKTDDEGNPVNELIVDIPNAHEPIFGDGDDVEFRYKSEQVIEIYSTPAPLTYYKLADPNDPNQKTTVVEREWFGEESARTVEAFIVESTAYFSDYQGVLKIYEDKDFTKLKGTYTSDPLDVENNVYILDGDEYTFKDVNSSTDFKVYKNGGTDAVTGHGFTLKNNPNGSGYVVFNNETRIVYPKMTLTKAIDPDKVITIVDKWNGKTVNIDKRDITNDEEVVGAELTITDKDGKVIDSWTSDGTVHAVKGLIPGETYTLHEENAPEGYEPISTDITFTVDENGNVIVTSTNTWSDETRTGDAQTVGNTLIVNDTKKPTAPGTVSITVRKQWTGIGTPEEVTVYLVKDGEVTSESVKLNSGNNWTAAFTGLEEGHVYDVEEAVKVTLGYSYIGTEQESEGTFIITNELKEQPTEPKPEAQNIVLYKSYEGADLAYMSESERSALLAATKFELRRGNDFAIVSPVWDGTHAVVTFSAEEWDFIRVNTDGYVLQEVNAPESFKYEKSAVRITIRIDENGTVWYSTNGLSFDITPPAVVNYKKSETIFPAPIEPSTPSPRPRPAPTLTESIFPSRSEEEDISAGSGIYEEGSDSDSIVITIAASALMAGIAAFGIMIERKRKS